MDGRDSRSVPSWADGTSPDGSLAEDISAIQAAIRGEIGWQALAGRLGAEPCWLEDVALSGDPQAARGTLERAAGDPGVVSAVVVAPLLKRRMAAVVGWGLGDWALAEALLVSSLEALHWVGDAPAISAVATQLAWLRGAAGDLEAQLSAAREVVAAERSAGSSQRLRRAATAGAWAAAWLGRGDEADGLLSDLPVGDGRGGCATTGAVHALARALAGRPAEAEAALVRVGTGVGASVPSVMEAVAVTATVTGRPARLSELAATVERWSCGPADPRRRLVIALCVVAAVERDDAAEARRLMEHLERIDETPAGPSARWDLWARLAIRWREDGARAVVNDAVGLIERMSGRWTALDVVVALWTSDAAREAGDAAAAGLISNALGRGTPRGGGRVGEWAAAIVDSNALLTTGRGDGANPNAASGAADGLTGLGALGMGASARAAAGRLAVKAGDRAQAISSLTRAAEDLRRLEARRPLTGVLADLAALGQDGRRAASALGGLTLTARELEVARLAAGGLSAQAIADRLVISRRTVETHLAHIYAKLGVRGRHELEVRAGELGLR